MSPSDGFVLPVDKPEGPTSHDVVAAARRALGERRIGHTGTLDPFASGLLLLCVGRATRLAEYLTRLDKTYEATARLGLVTDTLDLEGAVVETRDGWAELKRARISEALLGLAGEVEQVPPQFSAKKVGGVAMHRRARRGERVELEPSVVRIDSVELLDVDLPLVRFAVRCSSGTYVRAIARDLGEALGVGAHLTALRRTSIGALGVERAIPLDDLGSPEAVRGASIGMLDALRHLPRVDVDAEDAGRLAHGQRLRLAGASESGLVAVASDGRLLAVAEAREGVINPRKVFAR